MPDNKLVIRRLPPSMTEDDFLKQISPLPDHDYFCFFEAKNGSGLGSHCFSRAYINFLYPEDVSIFRQRFDNYVFLDKDGHEYPAVVEQALWHKIPNNGPFYQRNGISHDLTSLNDVNESITTTDPPPSPIVDPAVTGESVVCMKSPSWIEQDPEFIRFIERLQAQKKRPQHSPIQTLETNLDELTNPANTSSSANNKDPKVMTPLIGYVNQKRSMKSSKKSK